MMNIPLPQLLNAEGNTERTIIPVSVSVNLSITPLSYATIELPVGESLPARGYVEVFTSMGSAGIFRVRSPQDAYGDDRTTAELEHAIVEVGDWVVTQEYDEMMAADAAMTAIFSHYRGTKWQLGSVAGMGTAQIAVNVDHDRILEAMLGLLDQVPTAMLSFDFSTSPWTVNVVSRETVVSAEGRLSRNVSSARIIYDDTELCTRGYYGITEVSDAADIDSSSEAVTTWHTIDSPTIAKWGIVEREISVSPRATEEEALRVAQDYMNKHGDPRISITITAEELSSRTGEPWDTFTIGKLFRLALPDYEMTVEQCITGLAWNDVYGKPTSIVVNLADEEDTAVTFIHDIDAKGASGGGGGGKKKKDDEWKEYWTDFQMTDKYIEMMAVHVDTNDKILQQAGIYLDSDGVLQYSRDDENMLASHLQVQADRISLVVEGTGENASIKAAEIVASINETGSTVAISADHINISSDKTLRLLSGQMAVGADGALVIKSGGGMFVQRTDSGGTTATFGIWDKGNLTGGIMVDQINGQSVMKLKADVIDIKGLIKSLAAQKIGVGSLHVEGRSEFLQPGYFEAGLSSDENIVCPGVTIDKNTATWQSKSVVTSVSITMPSISRSNSRQFVYAVNGNTGNLSTVAGSIITAYTAGSVSGLNTETIYYLGRAGES